MFERFRGLSEEEIGKLRYHDYTKSEVEYLINETILSYEDKLIAKLRFIECKTYNEILDIVLVTKGCKVTTDRPIQRRVPQISKKLIETEKRIVPYYTDNFLN